MIDVFCRWWLRLEIEATRELLAGYVQLCNEYRNQELQNEVAE